MLDGDEVRLEDDLVAADAWPGLDADRRSESRLPRFARLQLDRRRWRISPPSSSSAASSSDRSSQNGVVVSGRGAGEEAPALARQVPLDLASRARRRTRRRAARIDGVRQRGVHGDRREPAGGERLLHARRRQRIDERSGVADQQPPLTGIRAWRDTGMRRIRAARRRATASGDEAAEHRASSRSRRRYTSADDRPRARSDRSRIDHRRNVTHARRDRHRPHPPIVVRLDQACACRQARASRRRAAIRRTSAIVRGPSSNWRRPVRARDHAGTAAAIEDEGSRRV